MPCRDCGSTRPARSGRTTGPESKIHCKHCSVKHHNNGSVIYSRTVITPVITAPGMNTILPLEPEFITPQDAQ